MLSKSISDYEDKDEELAKFEKKAHQGPADYTTLASSITTRGFTNHENLDVVGLIHMNGRVYDPNLGRFLSADPFIQAPNNLQSFNRYSYAWNNPLNGTDPSGFTLIGGAVGDYETDYNDMADDNRNRNNSNDRSSGNRDSGSNYNSLDDRIGIDFDRVFESKGPTQTEINHHVDNAGGYNDDVSDYASVNGNHGGVLSDKPRNVISINPDDFDVWVNQRLAYKLGVPVDTVTKTGLIIGGWKSIVKGFSRLATKLRGLFGKTDKLDEARQARDALAASAAKLSNSKRPVTVTAGYNTKTGEVVAKACGGGKCAEDHVVDALGGKKENVRFTEAMRPRTGKQVPVCTRCENSYGRDPFPGGTTLFQSDQ